MLLTLCIGIGGMQYLQQQDLFTRSALILTSVVGLVALLCLLMVLMPLKDPFSGIQMGGYSPSNTYYLKDVLSAAPHNSVQSIADRMLATDWVRELAYELLKLSIIRDKKHFWYTFGIRVGFGSVICLLVAVARTVYVWPTPGVK